MGLWPQLTALTALATRPSTLRNAAARLYRTPRDTPESEVYSLAGDALECSDSPWHRATPTVGTVACQPSADDGLVYRDLPKYANPDCQLISSEKSGPLADFNKIQYSGCYEGQVIAATATCLMAPGMSVSGVRRAKAAFLSGCEYHPAILLQPEAIGAVMECIFCLKGINPFLLLGKLIVVMRKI